MTYTTPAGKMELLYEDALNQKHLLIAGKSGSGKSVFVNGLIWTALYSAPGSQAGGKEFILIDAKGVELSRYADLPHTIAHAVSAPERLSALMKAEKIMDNRFAEMRKYGEKLYHGGDLYVIIDEFADLVTTQRRETVPIIQRLSQLGRAARVHLVLCTQSPIAKILMTEVKVNFDAIVGLKTRSAQDSRNIIGMSGLEDLPEPGHCYYITPSKESLTTFKMYTEYELDERVEHWTKQEPRAWRGLLKLLGA